MIVNCVDLLIDHLLINYFRASGKNYFENNFLELILKNHFKCFLKRQFAKKFKILICF